MMRRMIVFEGLLVGMLGLLSPPVSWAAPARSPQLNIQIKQWRLENGLRVIFSPKRNVPGVSVQLWYHVGSKNERVGLRGVAHMFEHMMFKGSDHVPPEKHAQLISAIGGQANAFTASDVTAYHNTVPKQYLEFAMKLEAERMRQLRLTQQTIDSEREVVKEEKRMRLENNPIGRALEALFDLAYVRHPYAWTPAGVIADLNQVTPEQIRSFYKTYYLPNNATLIVVGDTTEQEVRDAAERQFGPVPRGEDVPPVAVKEPPQTDYREKVADWGSQLNLVLGAYHVPEATHPDIAVLDVLSAILSAGRSSRLHQALVRQEKVALQAGGFVQAQEDPGVLVIYGVGLPHQSVEQMKRSLLAQVARLAQEPVSQAELEKVKNQLSTRFLGKLETLQGLAHQIGQSAYLRGDPRAFLGDVQRFDQVRAKDIQRAARTYLQKNNLSLVVLDATRKGGAQ